MSTIQTTNLKHESSGSNNIVLDSSGNIAVQAGTVSAPAIQATGDSNTGIYFPAADNIGFTTGGTIRGRWTTDGLCFNADTAAANALDDYEEGTWTPVINGSSSAGTATYGNQTGQYTKVGNLVTVRALISWSGHTGTGYLAMSGFPFSISSGQALKWSCENVVLSAGSQADIFAFGLFYQNPGGSTSTLNLVAMDAAGVIYINGSYFV